MADRVPLIRTGGVTQRLQAGDTLADKNDDKYALVPTDFAAVGTVLVSGSGVQTVDESSILAADVATAGSNFTADDIIIAGGNDKSLATSGVSISDVVVGGDITNAVFAPSTFAADNSILRSDGTARNAQSSDVVIDDAGRIGLGISTPGFAIDISGEAAVTSTINAARYSDNTSPPQIVFSKARGTAASPADVQTGDSVGTFAAAAYRNGSFSNLLSGAAAYYDFRITGTVSGDSTPCSFVFNVTAEGDTAASGVLVLWHNKSVILGIPSDIPGGNDEGLLVIRRRDDNFPTSISANTSGFKVADVDSTSEMFAWNEAGETVQLTGPKAGWAILRNENLLLWSRFDDGSGTTVTDYSSYSNSGTYTGTAAPSWGADHLTIGNSTDQIVTWPHTARLDLTDGFTIHLRCTILNSSATRGILFKVSSSSWNDGWGIVSVSNGNCHFFIDHYQSGDTVSFGNLEDSTQHDLCVTCDNTDLNAYVDGVLVTSASSSGTTGTGADINTNIPASSSCNIEYHDIKIYDRAGTFQDVQNLHNSPL